MLTGINATVAVCAQSLFALAILVDARVIYQALRVFMQFSSAGELADLGAGVERERCGGAGAKH
jgi:hypothetical protein